MDCPEATNDSWQSHLRSWMKLVWYRKTLMPPSCTVYIGSILKIPQHFDSSTWQDMRCAIDGKVMVNPAGAQGKVKGDPNAWPYLMK